MIKHSLKDTWYRLNTDIELYAKYTRIEKLSHFKWLSCFLTPPIQVMFLYRLSHYFFARGCPKIARLFYTINIVIYGADIGLSSQIGGGCHIPHPVGVVIYGNLGNNIFISQSVGIGGGTQSTINIGAGAGLPVIGDNVYLGAKSTIAGPVRIGNDSLIGFHSLVIKDVPENTIAIGTPARSTRKLKPGEIQTLTSLPPNENTHKYQ